jgi:hypothetical protein
MFNMLIFFRLANRWLVQFGIDLRVFFRSILSLPYFIFNYFKLLGTSNNQWPLDLSQPCLSDRFNFAGSLDKQYFYQDIYVSRKIFELAPITHVDIGSRIDGFIAQLSVFREVTVLDIRPLDNKINNVLFVQADICDSNFEFKKSMSVSCLHTIEHFGLGRYSDPVGANLWTIGLINIWNIVENGGILYLSTPIGRQRIVYNAHRVFKPSSVLNQLIDSELIDFAYINDEGKFNNGPLDILQIDEIASNFSYGLGIFTIKKKVL